MTSLLIVLLAGPSSAWAAEAPIITRAQFEATQEAPVTDVSATPESLSPIDWARVDRRSEGTYKAGKITLLSGLGASIVGSVIGQEELAVAGNLAFMTGMGMEAGSSLRQRRSLVERGQNVPATFGVVSWSLFGGSFVLAGASALSEAANPSSSDPNNPQINGTALALGLSGLVAQIGSIVASSAQRNANQKARYRMMREAAIQPPR